MAIRPYKPRFGLTMPVDAGEDGEGTPPPDNGEGLPTPHKVKIAKRRAAGIKEARAILEHLPGPNESTHVLCTARMDLTDIIGLLLDKHGSCSEMRVATLGYNSRNLAHLLAWLDSEQVWKLSLLTSIFFRAHKGLLWKETVEQFARRPKLCRVAAAHSHAKVVTMDFVNNTRLVIHGSANLCGNGSGREQFALDSSRSLHDFHSAWIGEMIDRHTAPPSNAPRPKAKT